jgi:hypothetical protein
MDDIKILLLKSGQHVITKLSELRAEEDEPLCFLFEVPLIVRYIAGETEDNTMLTFNLWCPYSKSLSFRVPFDYVVTIGEPKDQIMEKYVEYIQPFYPVLNDAEPETITNLTNKIEE